MLRGLLISASLISSLFLASNASACDDKPCETAYLSETDQYIENHIRRAKAYRMERLAYSKVRENRDYALYQHFKQLLLSSLK